MQFTFSVVVVKFNGRNKAGEGIVEPMEEICYFKKASLIR